MSEYSGSALVTQWIWSGGTVSLTGDHRTSSYEPSVKLVARSAGSDANETYLVSLKDGRISWSGVVQAGGTALEDALIEGASGTVIIGPEGTASGKRKFTIPAIAMGARLTWPYDDVCELSVDWQQNGARTQGTY